MGTRLTKQYSTNLYNHNQWASLHSTALIITAGKWNEAACMGSRVLQQHQQKSLDQVVDDRLGQNPTSTAT